MMKKLLISLVVVVVSAFVGGHLVWQHLKRVGENPDFIKAAIEAKSPNENFLFASNASLPGRIYMTYSGKSFRTCINTATSFYNKYHTCSKCTHFVANPSKWGFELTKYPKAGDLFIQHDTQTRRAFHAGVVVRVENGKCYANHAIRKNYYKNVELKSLSRFTFYRYNPSKNSRVASE